MLSSPAALSCIHHATQNGSNPLSQALSTRKRAATDPAVASSPGPFFCLGTRLIPQYTLPRPHICARRSCTRILGSGVALTVTIHGPNTRAQYTLMCSHVIRVPSLLLCRKLCLSSSTVGFCVSPALVWRHRPIALPANGGSATLDTVNIVCVRLYAFASSYIV